jgi:hypothetical protein
MSAERQAVGPERAAQGRDNLVVIDLAKKSAHGDHASSPTSTSGNFYWVNNKRLCLQVADGQDGERRLQLPAARIASTPTAKTFRIYTKLGVHQPRFLAWGLPANPLPRIPVHNEFRRHAGGNDVRSRDSFDVYPTIKHG